MIVLIVVLGTLIPIFILYLWKKANPPFLAYHIDGTITDEVDYDKPLHRLNGPALIIGKYREEYWINGIQHNIDGPAVIGYGIGGIKEYYINGIKIREKTFQKVRYCTKQELATYLVSPRKEIRELAEHRLKELHEKPTTSNSIYNKLCSYRAAK